MKTMTSIIAVALIGCVEPPQQCRHTSDCSPNEICRAQKCEGLTRVESSDDTEFEPQIVPDDVGRDFKVEDSAPDLPPHPCASASHPLAGNLIINEVNANVAAGDDGDANGDGKRDAYSDEFIELWNTTSSTLRLDGVEVRVGEAIKWKFDEPYCMPPGQAMVVFAHGAPKLSPDIPVVVAETRLSLSNSGGGVTLRLDEVELDHFEWGPDAECSWVRSPEGMVDGIPTPHSVCGGYFSPGRCCDGTATQNGCHTEEP
jgi:hypothetical protein